MNSDRLVSVSRTVTVGNHSITETASAGLPDDLALDPLTEVCRRHDLAMFLFLSLPSVQSKPSKEPCPKPPLNTPN